MKDNSPLLIISLPFAIGVFTSLYFPASGEASLLYYGTAIGVLLLADTIFLFYANTYIKVITSSLLFFCGILSGIVGKCCFEGSGQPDFILQSSLALKNAILELPIKDKDAKGLILALLCADRQELSAEVRAVFRASGASHLLALSGLHLGILAEMTRKMLLPLGNSPAMKIIKSVLIISCSGFYTFICGASPSLVRAFLFISFSNINSLLPSRKAPAVNCLLTSCLIQLSLSPKVIESISFQLSYLACTGIILLYRPLANWYPIQKGLVFRVWKSLAMSLSCQLFTAPLVAYKFKVLPKYFLLTNLFAIPICEALIYLSVLSILTSALGICPGALINVTQRCALLLINLLEKISAIP